jgi:MFS transporter, DHA2 family, methylenomycin A resistance protein
LVGAKCWSSPVLRSLLFPAPPFLASRQSGTIPCCRCPSLAIAPFQSSLVGLLVNLAFYGLIFDFSVYFQQIKKFTPLMTGLAFLPMTAIVVGANILSGRAASWLGARPPMVAGQAIFAAGCFFLTTINAGTFYGGLWWPMVLIGAGIGLTIPPVTSAVLATVDRKQSGVDSGVLNATRQIDSVIGVAPFGSLIANREKFVHGMHLSLYVSLVAVLIGALAALMGITGRVAVEARGIPVSKAAIKANGYLKRHSNFRPT